MFELLLIIVAGIFLFSCARFKFDFLEPCVVMTATMLFSIFIAIIFAEPWGYDVGIRTVICISAAMIFFTAGNVFSKRHFFTKNLDRDEHDSRIEVADWKILLALIIVSIFLLQNFRESQEMAISLVVGSKIKYTEIISENREAIEEGLVNFSRWMYYRSMVAQTLAYACIYAFLNNLRHFRIRDLLLILPVIMYIPFIILSTGRMWLICLVIYTVVVAVILFQRGKKFSIVENLSTIKIFFVAGIGFFAMFLLLGIFTGKTFMGDRDFSEILAHYAGLSIPALDMALNQQWAESEVVGEYTLLGVFRILSRLGMSLPDVPIFLPFIHFHGIDTNVYTAEARYIKDFGFLGMVSIMWILGVLYSTLYNFVRNRRSSLMLMFYGYFCSPLFLSSIDDRFFLDFFGTTMIYMFILLFIWKKVLFRGEYS